MCLLWMILNIRLSGRHFYIVEEGNLAALKQKEGAAPEEACNSWPVNELRPLTPTPLVYCTGCIYMLVLVYVVVRNDSCLLWTELIKSFNVATSNAGQALLSWKLFWWAVFAEGGPWWAQVGAKSWTMVNIEQRQSLEINRIEIFWR